MMIPPLQARYRENQQPFCNLGMCRRFECAVSALLACDPTWFGGPSAQILLLREGQVNEIHAMPSDSVKCHLPIEYAADLIPVVAGKEAGASWNARAMENALDF
jgi:hypothetical protein